MPNQLIIPMITPFQNNHLDRDTLEKFIAYAKKNGFDGVFAGSSTGGFASLSLEQHQKFLEWVIESSDGLTLYAGITRSSLIETLHMGKIASDLGYRNLVAINPFYHKYTQESIFRFFDSVLDAFDADVYAYNNPSLSGTEILPETLMKIREVHSNLVGLKDSGDNMEKFQEFLRIPGLKVYQGKDAKLLESIRLGAVGGVCMSSNFCLNTLKIARGDPESQRIADMTSALIRILSKYETPSIQNFLFRKYVLGEKNPVNYVNHPFGDVKSPPAEGELLQLMVLNDEQPIYARK